MEHIVHPALVVGRRDLVVDCKTAPAGTLRAGSGSCRACDCRGFRPTGRRNDVCAFCGHMWDRHW
jgi:hypothetical protein